MKLYEDHPLADIMPLMEPSDLELLATDIKAHGLKGPITLYEGKILDGRNRFRACKLVEVEPRFYEFKNGADPTEFILTANVFRRHLNESQRAMIAAKLATMREGRPAGNASASPSESGSSSDTGQICTVSDEEAGRQLNVSRRSVVAAKKVLAEGTASDIKAVEQGKKRVSSVASKLGPKKPRPPRDTTSKDELGREIPKEVQPDWDRAEEVGKKIYRLLSDVKDIVVAGLKGEEKDIVFAEILNPTLAEIDGLRFSLEQIKPYVLCPACQGRGRKQCTRCKHRGFQSKYLFTNTATAKEKEILGKK